MDAKYDALFTPWKVGNVEIKNRIVLCPMGGTSLFGWFELTGCHFDKEAAKLFLERAKNNVGLIIPGIAAPATVFFMRQFMLASLPLDLLNAARIDGSGEFNTFNNIALPIMKPAMATQAIFSFVSKWNELFMPSILLTDNEKYTMPIMVSLLRGDIYKVEYGAIYLGLTLTALPLLIVYFCLSKYIIAGVAVGGVKE